MTKSDRLYDHQEELFKVQNAVSVMGAIIENRLDAVPAKDEAQTLFQLRYVQRHAQEDIDRLIIASGSVTRDAPNLDEYRAAELLDQALQARHDFLTASHQHESYDHPDAIAADEREDETSAKLLALDAVSPAVTAAQLAYLVASGESGECVFESRWADADWLDFAAVEGYADTVPVQQGAAKVVAAYLRTHEDSPVAAVIARHRAIGKCRRGPGEAAEAAE